MPASQVHGVRFEAGLIALVLPMAGLMLMVGLPVSVRPFVLAGAGLVLAGIVTTAALALLLEIGVGHQRRRAVGPSGLIHQHVGAQRRFKVGIPLHIVQLRYQLLSQILQPRQSELQGGVATPLSARPEAGREVDWSATGLVLPNWW